jgi:hypothetical protein
MTRRGCLLGVVLWLVVMLIPLAILIFAIRGEVSWQRGPFVEDRLWLINLNGAPGEESASGVAYSSTRLVPNSAAVDGRLCAETNVYFLLWRGHSDPATYCQCYQPRPASAGGYDVVGQCS